MATLALQDMVAHDEAGIEGIWLWLFLASMLALGLFLGFCVRLYRRQPDLDSGASRTGISSTPGLFPQPDPPSAQPPNKFHLPSFSGEGHPFLFGAAADLAAELILEILNTQEKWVGVSRERLVAQCKQDGALTILAVTGADNLAMRNFLRSESIQGHRVYFVRERMLTMIIEATQP